MPGPPEDAARFLLEQGESVSEVAKKTGLKPSEVAKINKTVTAKPRNENPESAVK